MAKKGVFAGAGYDSPQQGFQYSQQDIFRDTFANRATMEDLNRMFAQAGLRFDPEFLNRVFFGAGNVVFRVYRFGGASPQSDSFNNGMDSSSRQNQVTPSGYKPNILERWAAKATMKLGNFAIRKLFGIQNEAPRPSLDQYQELKISSLMAESGGEKEFLHTNGSKPRKLMVRIPAGIQSGTQIRLKGMGQRNGKYTGDLYLRVKVTG